MEDRDIFFYWLKIVSYDTMLDLSFNQLLLWEMVSKWDDFKNKLNLILVHV